MNHQFNLERPSVGVLSEEGHNLAFGTSKFQPLPKPTGKAPYHLDLKSVLPQADYDKIGKVLKFHFLADVGGIKNPAPQTLVAEKLELEINPQNVPAFAYIGGDVVYYYGNESEYDAQFLEPYKHYPAPIFAIPGNHDGDVDITAKKSKSLDAFVKHFCAPSPSVVSQSESVRTAMTQPNVYWTLVTPVANIIGLYTNVPSGGVIKDDQKAWFINELKSAQVERKNKAILVALHHPPFSMDHSHGASSIMQNFLAECFAAANVYPDLVLSGHVHNYQRFTQTVGAHKIPYIVCGNGGYWHLHNVGTHADPVSTPSKSSFDNVMFEAYDDTHHGFTEITIDKNKNTLRVDYLSVPLPHEDQKAPANLVDSLVVNL